MIEYSDTYKEFAFLDRFFFFFFILYINPYVKK